ncbi:MAG TPA: ABC transporter permease subunit [Candidatus Sulfotelmatobacter sp.]|nr:ABC transporter permease subunit [Candidatus Sulfotelmatobacter sp.]
MKLNLAIVATLFRTELRMVLRDRRMVLTSIVLPLLIMPLVFLGSNWSIQKRETTLRNLVCRYAVTGSQPERVRALLAAAGQRLQTEKPKDKRPVFHFEEVKCGDATAALAKGEVHLVLESLTAEAARSQTNASPLLQTNKTPATTQAQVAQDEGEEPVAGAPVVRIFFRADRDESSSSLSRLREALSGTRRAQRAERLQAQGFPVAPTQVAQVTEKDVASGKQVAGLTLGRTLTLLLLFFVLTSGAVVATDSLAGEKERGTLETLLTTAVNRGEILAAKQLLILAVALLITFIQTLNLLVYISFKLIPVPGNLAAAVPPGVVALLFLLFLPVAAVAANVLLLVSGCAKSYKEAQMYFFPVFLLGLLPALAPFLPGVPLRSAIALVPVANIAVAAKEILTGRFDWPLIALSWLVTAAAAVWTTRLGVRVLSAEKLITATDTDAVDFAGGPALFERHVLRWFALLWAVLLLVNNYFEKTDLRVQLLVNLVVLFFGAACLMIRRYRLDPRQALALRLPKPAVWLAVLAGVPGGLLTALGLFRLANLVIPVPAKVLESFSQSVLSADIPFLQLLFFLTVMPGIFEEIAFRGILLHGLRRRLHPVALAVVVGITFGLFHVTLFRFVPTAFLGMMLAAVTLLTGSIYPAMLWHALSNATGILMSTLHIPETELEPICYLAGVGLLATAFWILWRHRTPYPGLRPWKMWR